MIWNQLQSANAIYKLELVIKNLRGLEKLVPARFFFCGAWSGFSLCLQIERRQASA